MTGARRIKGQAARQRVRRMPALTGETSRTARATLLSKTRRLQRALKAQTAPSTRVVTLWARSARVASPHFVTAWSESLDGMCHEDARIVRSEAEQRFAAAFARWGERWTFWTTVEQLDIPAVPIGAAA